MSEIFRVALGSIAANPFRAVLTMLGVVIGVGSVITMLALGRGAARAVDEQLAALGANVVTVTTGMRFAQGVARDQQLLTIDDARALADHGGLLVAVVPEQSSRQQLKLGNRNLNLSVIGTTPQHAEVNGYTLQAGRRLMEEDGRARRRVAVIGGDVAQQLRQPAAELVGRTLLIKAMPFEIVGVYAMKGAVGFGNPDDDVYIPIETSRYRVTGDDRVQTIAVEVERGTELAQAMVTVERVLRRVHRLPPGRDNDFAIVDRKQFLATQQETTQILGFLLAGIAGVSLLVGGIGIMNIMLVTVTERTREIGVRMALGATRTHILAQFMIEALLLCIVGGIIGILAGAGASWALSSAAGWRTAITTDALLLAFVFSAAVGLVFGLWPARRAALLDPIEALRHE
jgi:putative ABC transport system permease protein